MRKSSFTSKLSPLTVDTSSSTSVVTQSQLSTVQTQIAQIEGGSTTRRGYSPFLIKTIFSTNQTLSGTLGAGSGEYVVLTNQTTSSENGLYLSNGVGLTKISKDSTPLTRNLHFVEDDISTLDGNCGVFNYTDETYLFADIHSYDLYHTLSTTDATQTTAFTIPVAKTRVTYAYINACIVSTSAMYSIVIEDSFHKNSSGTVKRAGYAMVKRSVSSSALSDTSVTFDVTSNVVTLKVTGIAATSLTWYIKGFIQL